MQDTPCTKRSKSTDCTFRDPENEQRPINSIEDDDSEVPDEKEYS